MDINNELVLKGLELLGKISKLSLLDPNWSWIEIVYYISAPIMIVLGLLVFGQLKQGRIQIEQTNVQLEATRVQIKKTEEQIELAKSDMEIRMYRESVIHAIKQSEEFENMIVEFSDIKKIVEQENLYKKLKIDQICSFTTAEIMLSYHQEYKEWVESENIGKNFKRLIIFSNRLEAFSIYFNEEIAHEGIAIKCMHKMYLEMVESIYPVICVNNVPEECRLYQNVIALYKRWKAIEVLKNLTLYEEMKIYKEKKMSV